MYLKTLVSGKVSKVKLEKLETGYYYYHGVYVILLMLIMIAKISGMTILLIGTLAPGKELLRRKWYAISNFGFRTGNEISFSRKT
jgi:hypothetical protein